MVTQTLRNGIQQKWCAFVLERRNGDVESRFPCLWSVIISLLQRDGRIKASTWTFKLRRFATTSKLEFSKSTQTSFRSRFCRLSPIPSPVPNSLLFPRTKPSSNLSLIILIIGLDVDSRVLRRFSRILPRFLRLWGLRIGLFSHFCAPTNLKITLNTLYSVKTNNFPLKRMKMEGTPGRGGGRKRKGEKEK